MGKIIGRRAAGKEHQVMTVEGNNGIYRRRPCADCPWRKDAVGEFPAEAFGHSAGTAYDMSEHSFGCHQSGADKGGANEDRPLNSFLLELRRIYDGAAGKKKAFERFFEAVTATFPEYIRPILPEGVDSISRRVNRIQKKQKEFLAKQRKTKRKSN